MAGMHIIFITDSKKVDALKIASSLPQNSWIILRDYDLGFDERYQLGLQLKKICTTRKLKLLVAKDISLAIRLNADGMHFPEFMISKISFWRTKKANWIITASAHNYPACRKAALYGATSILISPIYKTGSHPGKKPLGRLPGAKIAGQYVKKAHGLGGLMHKNAKTLQSLGFTGFATISGLQNCGYDATVSSPKGTK
jgi:thiamine-phosphate pyrophosphorylase